MEAYRSLIYYELLRKKTTGWTGGFGFIQLPLPAAGLLTGYTYITVALQIDIGVFSTKLKRLAAMF